MMLQRFSGDETGIKDEPDMTLVSGITSTDVSCSISPEKSIVTTPGRSASGSSSLLSFEQHERSILDAVTPQTLRKPSQHALSMAVASSGSPAPENGCGRDTRAEKDPKAVGVRFLLPMEDTSQPGAVDIKPGIFSLMFFSRQKLTAY